MVGIVFYCDQRKVIQAATLNAMPVTPLATLWVEDSKCLLWVLRS